MTSQETNERIEWAFNDPAVIQAAVERGVADAARQYAQAGQLMASWKNGKVVWVDPITFAEVERIEQPVATQ